MAVVSLAEAREARRPQESPNTGGKGFALLHRKIMDTPFYKDPEASHLWVHLLLRANYEPTVVHTELGEVLCQRGQFISGRNALAFETGIESDRVQYLLRKYQKLGMISTQSTKKFTVFTVIKYDEYQQFSVPTDYQQITNAKPVIPTGTAEVVPTDYQQITTEKELNNNSLDKSNECASAAENQEKKKPSVSCQDVVDAYHEILPEAPSIRLLSEKRKNLIRTFWKKAGVITRKLDNKPFTIEAWREYLGYISMNCRWMLESRPNQKTGTTWRKRDFEFYLNDNTYLKVREGGHDDNDR
ncbi:DNA replication protein [Pectobacterium parmentieri]|uniref:DNA replication protein n=1 Tax=Pectobacterium parmentieri TaxID=1905730 RepID=UPI0018E00087|nr:DNA replication protein [Pectobacterium parmentieri]MBI0520738.1 DNA replication protein [Pectobacterium parmentieri]QQA77039.1 DNA replication protein [Pectobacterium parmentieri]